MNDVIYRKAVIDMIMGQPPEAHYPSWYAEQIKGLSSVESEIIRCKDCKHWKSKEFIGNNDVYTINLSSLPCKNWLTASDWYCGSAERKEE